MIHCCYKDNFVCSQRFQNDCLVLEAQFGFELNDNATWTGEIYTEVTCCPFCGYKCSNVPVSKKEKTIDH